MIDGLKPYPAYKDSGVPWLGQVPEHWGIERAKWLFRKMNREVCEDDGVVTCFRDGMVTLRKNRRERGFTEALKEIGYQGVHKGDLVIHAMDAFAGAVGVSDSHGKCTPVYSVCRPSANANPWFYAHIVREMARSQWILALAKGIRERSTDFRFDAFASQFVPLPPRAEQDALARFLDYADRRIRRYLVAKRKLIALLNEQKQAIINQAVTRGLDPNVRLKPSGVEWQGDVPEHWSVMPLRRVTLERCDGPFGSGLKSAHYTDHGIRVVRLQNIGQGEFQGSDAAFISPSYYATLGDHTVMEGDVLIAGLGDENHPAGRSCVAPKDIGPAMVKADCFRFRLDDRRVDPQFAAHYLSATASAATQVLSRGATRQRINLQSMAGRPIAFPMLLEQHQIVARLGRDLAPLEAAMVRFRTQVEAIREYRTRLIADVVTGKLDVREAAANLPEQGEEAVSVEEEHLLGENCVEDEGAEPEATAEDET